MSTTDEQDVVKLTLISFGSEIDVASFSFSRLKRGEKLPKGVPTSLKLAFKVDMLKHWVTSERRRDYTSAAYIRSVDASLRARSFASYSVLRSQGIKTTLT